MTLWIILLARLSTLLMGETKMDQSLIELKEQGLQTTWEEDIELAKTAMGRSAFYAVEAGKLFKEAKDKHRVKYGSGQGGDRYGWKQALEERGISQQAADELIRVYERFGTATEIPSALQRSVMLQLASPSVPQAAVEEVVERAQAGERVSIKDTEAIIARAKAEARREQEFMDRRQFAAQQSEREAELTRATDRITNLQATLDRVTADRRKAEQEVSELQTRIAAGPSQRLRDELEDKEALLTSARAEAARLRTELAQAKGAPDWIDDLAKDVRRFIANPPAAMSSRIGALRVSFMQAVKVIDGLPAEVIEAD